MNRNLLLLDFCLIRNPDFFMGYVLKDRFCLIYNILDVERFVLHGFLVLSKPVTT